MSTYTVVAAYWAPPQIYCETVEAPDPDAAIEAAWEVCREANWGVCKVDRESEWADVMVIAGPVSVVA